MKIHPPASTWIICIVAVCGASVLLSWAGLFPEGLRSIIPGAVTMKEMTAFGLVMSCLGSVFTVRAFESEGAIESQARALIGICVSLLIALPVVLVALRFPLTWEGPGAAMSVAAGVPSIGTALAFICQVFVINIQPGRFPRRIMAWTVLSLGCVGLAGYMFNAPALYWHLHDYSSAMAVHSAACFVLLGLATLIEREPEAR